MHTEQLEQDTVNFKEFVTKKIVEKVKERQRRQDFCFDLQLLFGPGRSEDLERIASY